MIESFWARERDDETLVPVSFKRIRVLETETQPVRVRKKKKKKRKEKEKEKETSKILFNRSVDFHFVMERFVLEKMLMNALFMAHM